MALKTQTHVLTVKNEDPATNKGIISICKVRIEALFLQQVTESVPYLQEFGPLRLDHKKIQD